MHLVGYLYEDYMTVLSEVCGSHGDQHYEILGIDTTCSGRLVGVYTVRYHKVYQTSRHYCVGHFVQKILCRLMPNYQPSHR